ncbi:MAG: non-canonical purine NTP pyrophosphatase [Patescibacteria group bacterium]
MKFQIVLATANPSKARELGAALADLSLEIQTLNDFPNLKLPPETGETFEENARIKAEFVCEQTGLPTLADDSGILVEALPDELGVKTVRFGAGENASDAEWLAHFLERMKNEKNRKAKFVCVLALAITDPPKSPLGRRDFSALQSKMVSSPEKGKCPATAGRRGFTKTTFFRGEVTGEILPEIEAPILPRIPLSSVFLADGAERVFAAMSEKEKEEFSHRGRAVAKLKEFLANF